MSVIAAIRHDEVNFPLFLHVLGAMLLVGTLFAVATATVLEWRRPGEAPGLTRFGLRTVLLGVLPAYVLMRIGAQWTESREKLPEEVEDSTWLAIGYITADAGAVLILVAIVLSALGLRRLRDGRGRGFGRAAGIISLLLLAAYLVAVWAMSAKPD
jgi:uncharacterized membrane protein